MMLVLIATTSVVPVMASPNTTTVNVHYVVADTSLKSFCTNPNNYFETVWTEEETNQLVKCQNKWEQEFLYPNIKNGTIAIYEPEDYIKKKAKESKYNISQETVDKLITKAKAYNYSITTPYGKKFAYQERTYGGSQQYAWGYKDGEAWKLKDNFTIIGSLVDDYTDYNNNEYYYNGNTPYSLTDTTTNVIYEKSVNLTVNYIDEEGKELAPSATEQGWSSEAYTTSAIDVKGYELTETPSNANGVYTTQDTVVNYIYKKVPDVVVQKPEQPIPSSPNKTEETITKTEEVEVINTGDEIQHYIVIGAILLLVLIASLGIIISKIKKNNC